MKQAMRNKSCYQCQYYQREQTGPHEWVADCTLKQVHFLNADHCAFYLPGGLLEENNDWPKRGLSPCPS